MDPPISFKYSSMARKVRVHCCSVGIMHMAALVGESYENLRIYE